MFASLPNVFSFFPLLQAKRHQPGICNADAVFNSDKMRFTHAVL